VTMREWRKQIVERAKPCTRCGGEFALFEEPVRVMEAGVLTGRMHEACAVGFGQRRAPPPEWMMCPICGVPGDWSGPRCAPECGRTAPPYRNSAGRVGVA